MKSLRQRSDVVQCAYQQNFSGNGRPITRSKEISDGDNSSQANCCHDYILIELRQNLTMVPMFLIRSLKSLKLILPKEKGVEGRNNIRNRYTGAIYSLTYIKCSPISLKSYLHLSSLRSPLMIPGLGPRLYLI